MRGRQPPRIGIITPAMNANAIKKRKILTAQGVFSSMERVHFPKRLGRILMQYKHRGSRSLVLRQVARKPPSRRFSPSWWVGTSFAYRRPDGSSSPLQRSRPEPTRTLRNVPYTLLDEPLARDGVQPKALT